MNKEYENENIFTVPENKILTPFVVSFLTRKEYDLTSLEVKICLKQIKTSGIDYFSRGLRFYNLSMLKLNALAELAEIRKKLANTSSSSDEKVTALNRMLTVEIQAIEKLLEIINTQLEELAITDEERTTFDADNFLNLCAIYVNKPYRIDRKDIADILGIYKKIENLEGFKFEDKKEVVEKINAIADRFSTVENDYYYNSRLRLGNGGNTSLSGKCAERIYRLYEISINSKRNYQSALLEKYISECIESYILLALNKGENYIERIIDAKKFCL